MIISKKSQVKHSQDGVVGVVTAIDLANTKIYPHEEFFPEHSAEIEASILSCKKQFNPIIALHNGNFNELVIADGHHRFSAISKHFQHAMMFLVHKNDIKITGKYSADDVFKFALKGKMLPPKTTYFTPKIKDGIYVFEFEPP